MTTAQRFTANTKSAANTVWHYRLLVLCTLVILGVLSFIFVNSLQKQYVAGANLLVVNGTTRDDPTLSSPDLPAIATSTVVLSRMKTQLGIATPLTTIKRHLTVKQPPYRSSILRIEYTDPNPQQAQLVANGVAEQLTTYYRQISTARFDDDIRALDSEMSKQRDRTRALSAQLGPNDAVATVAGAPQGNGGINHLADLETSGALAQASLQGDTSALAATKNNAAHQRTMVRYEVLHGDPTYVNLQTNAANSVAALASARAAYTPNYPGMAALEAKAKSLQASLDSEGKRVLASSNAYSPSMSAAATDESKGAALVAADRAKVAAINSLIATERARASQSASSEGARLERDAAQVAYQSLAARRATALANRADALSLGSVVIVDRAIASDSQVGLGHGKLLLFFGLIVLALAISSAFIADQFNPRFSRASVIEDLYGRPVVATIGRS